MATQEVILRFRDGTAADWALSNRILQKSEPGVESDTHKFKIGNGVDPWNQLPYYLSEDPLHAYITEQISNGVTISQAEVERITEQIRLTLEVPELPDLVLYYENTKA